MMCCAALRCALRRVVEAWRSKSTTPVASPKKVEMYQQHRSMPHHRRPSSAQTADSTGEAGEGSVLRCLCATCTQGCSLQLGLWHRAGLA